MKHSDTNNQIDAFACSLKTPEYWAPDGVHPSPEGHALIAKSWIKYFDV